MFPALLCHIKPKPARKVRLRKGVIKQGYLATDFARGSE